MPAGKSPILQNDLMAQNDTNKFTLYNTGLVALEDSINRSTTISFAAGNVTLTETQLLRFAVYICTTASATRELVIPPTVGTAPAVTTNRTFGVLNTSGQTITVTHGSGSTVDVLTGQGAFIHADGTNISLLAGNSSGGGGSAITIQDEGSNLTTALSQIDFVGAGVTATNTGGNVTVTIPGGGGSAITAQDEGANLTTALAQLDFVGAGVTATNTGGNVTVTIPGGGGSAITIQDEGSDLTTTPAQMNFVGAGVTATTSGNNVTVTVPGSAGGGTSQNWSVPFKGAMASFTTTKNAQNLSGVAVAWDEQVFDTYNIYDLAQPTRMSVPAGVSYVRVSGGMIAADGTVSNAANLYLSIRKNGSAFYKGVPMMTSSIPFNNEMGTLTSGAIPVVGGTDFFEFHALLSGDTDVNLSSSSYFALEVLELSTAQSRLFDISTFVPGTPTAGATILQYVFSRDGSIPLNAAGAQSFAGTAATGVTVFTITKNGASIGTATFAGGTQIATFSVTATSFVAGDRIAIVAPNPADASLADINFTIPLEVV
jgi:hypothetical protein